MTKANQPIILTATMQSIYALSVLRKKFSRSFICYTSTDEASRHYNFIVVTVKEKDYGDEFYDKKLSAHFSDNHVPIHFQVARQTNRFFSLSYFY